METKKIRQFRRPFLGVALIGALGAACSHAPVAPPYDSVSVDRSDPGRTVIVLNGPSGACVPPPPIKRRDPAQERKADSVTENGTTYYFSSDADRDRFLQTYEANSRY